MRRELPDRKAAAMLFVFILAIILLLDAILFLLQNPDIVTRISLTQK